MKNFIDFMVEASKTGTLAEEFHQNLGKGNHAELSQWFSKNGYGVNEQECKKILDNRNDIKSSRLGIY